jgi:ribose transport system ATP-binding protein
MVISGLAKVSEETPTPWLYMREITKTFPGSIALDSVSFSLGKGEVHGLVGENGAGKSTLIKILSGLYHNDAGAILIDGKEVTFSKPSDAEDAGIYVLHQERQLVARLTVAESLFLGRNESQGRLFSKKTLNARSKKAFKELLDLDFNPNSLVADLKPAEQQMIQLARVMLSDPRLVIFDEPTAPLNNFEAKKLFRIIEGLKSRGVSVIYISHYLQEVQEVCGRVTVLRNGKNAGEMDVRVRPLNELIYLMIGKDVERFKDYPQRTPVGNPVLGMKDVWTEQIKGLSFSLSPGEILGITGLVGSGVDQIAEVLMGIQKIDRGSCFHSENLSGGFNPKNIINSGVAYIPADRRSQGAILAMTSRENLALVSGARLGRFGFIRSLLEKSETHKVLVKLDVQPQSLKHLVGLLSGGNQQKVVIGKWLVRGSNVIIMDQPTVGVDISAKAEIYRIVEELTRNGVAVLLLTQDLEELKGLSDRALVIYRGKVVKEFERSTITVEQVLAFSTGASVSQGEDNI